MILTGLEDMDLEQTLDCGQCFRFEPTPDGGWRGVAGGRAAVLHRREDGLHILPGDDFWRDYLDADRDYAAIRREFERDEILRPCVAYAPGIRVLRQPAWEALVAFIVSQNNNVPRIKGILARLCRNFGEPVGWDYGFPSPERLAEQSVEALAPLRCGWRAAYLLDAAQKVASGALPLEQIAALPLPEARQALQTVRGVGPKVAECVLLYGMGRLEAFPLDVWMKRAMAVLFPGRRPEDFGPCAGIAQQYIFHYCRRHPDLVRAG